jgi:hypothetical protein
MPEPMTTFFLHNWMNGQKASDAARHAYEATIPFYRPFYPPTIRVKTKRTTVKVPCPTWSEPFRMCDKVIEVPDGIETIDNAKITDSQPLTAGASTAVF